jgi:hypothetical protein
VRIRRPDSVYFSVWSTNPHILITLCSLVMHMCRADLVSFLCGKAPRILSTLSYARASHQRCIVGWYPAPHEGLAAHDRSLTPSVVRLHQPTRVSHSEIGHKSIDLNQSTTQPNNQSSLNQRRSTDPSKMNRSKSINHSTV